ncbi:MAG: cbb3-type cytochrome c oxidase subunit II [Planctomycetota bacterium]
MESAAESDHAAIRYDDSPIRLFGLATLVWGILTVAAGIFDVCLRLYPELFQGVYELGYGRMQPLYPNLAIFGFVANALFTAVYYSTQRLCKTRLWSKALCHLHFLTWQAIVFAMLWTLGHGIKQPRLLAEAEWPLDIAVGVVWIVCFALNLFMTVANRREQRIYISIWFYLASAVTVGAIYAAGNIASPGEGWTSEAMLGGVPSAMVQSWYHQNLSGFLLMMPMIGAMYYFLPKMTGRPIRSYRLAVFQFWGFVVFYGWTAMRPLHYAPIPDLAGSLAVVFGLMLWMPQWGGVVNGWFAFQGHWKRLASEPCLPFMFVSVLCFGLLTVADVFASLRDFAAWTQYTDWASAHRELLVYGFNGMMALGIVYWIMPRVLRSDLWSPIAAKAHFGLALAGLLLLATPLFIAGLMQGTMWMGLDDSGQLAHPEFIDALTRAKPMWFASMLGLGLFGVGLVLQLVNFVLTWLSSLESSAGQEVVGPKASPTSEQFASSLDGAPVLALAVGLDRMSTFEWHQAWERNPVRICLVVLVCLFGSSVLLVGPTLLFANSIPTTSNFQPYTPLELAGRRIYVREGCYNCHSQTVRPLVAETKRYGEYSQRDEFAFDNPILWGVRRIGPDLAREGGGKPSYWHWQHLQNPRFEQKESVMPSFEYLLHERLDFDQIARFAVTPEQSDPISETTNQDKDQEDPSEPASEDPMVAEAKQSARLQAERISADIIGLGGPVMRGDLMTYDTKAIALIAYLQRLGTDLSAPPQKSNAGN